MCGLVGVRMSQWAELLSRLSLFRRVPEQRPVSLVVAARFPLRQLEVRIVNAPRLV